MDIKTTLRKLLNNEFQPTLSRIAKKWRDPKDLFLLVLFIERYEALVKTYTETVRRLREEKGYPVGNEKSANIEEVLNYLLRENGKVGEDGNYSLSGSDSASTYWEERQKATQQIGEFNKTIEVVLDAEHVLTLPRLLKVKEEHVKKELITAHDCYILRPILDLSDVGGMEEQKAADDAEDDRDTE